MAVTFISNGYDAAPAGSAWADSHPSVGQGKYGVRSGGDWRVTAGAGLAVQIAAGRGFGHGVTDYTFQVETLTLDPVASGTRWDTIAVRRDWRFDPRHSSFVKIMGGPGMALAANRQSSAGNLDDQPLALVPVTPAGVDASRIIDLRTWSGDGGGVVAAHDLVKTFLNAAGTQLWIDGVEWVRRLKADGTPEWVHNNFHGLPTNARQVVKTGNVSLNTTPYGDAYLYFDEPFPNALVSVQGTDATDPAHWPALILKWAAVYSDRTRLCFRVYDHGGNVMASKTNINISYTATGY